MRILKFIILTVTVVAIAVNAFADEVVLVVNSQNPVVSVTPQEAKNIFLGKKNDWSNGRHILPILQENTDITEEFTLAVMKRSVQQFKLYWRKMVFSGKSTPIVQVKNSQQLKKMLAENPGGIGYMLESELDSSIKRLAVISKDLPQGN